MPFKKAIRFCGVYLLAAIMLWVPTVAQAEMLSTQKTLQSLSNNAEKREWLTSMVLRREVQTQLQEYGISKTESLNRVNSMTDDEVVSVIDQIEEYAAAGDPLWRASGEKDAGHIFTIIVAVIVIGCLAFCWIIFIWVILMKRRVALNLRFLICAGLSCLVWTGCATAPPKVELPLSLDIPRTIELSDVPFYPQGEYQCGPASLAMTLAWSGVAITPEQLKPEVYTPSREGSLPPDMIGAARRHGRVAYPIHRVEDILKEVAGGHPVIVLQRLRSFFQYNWHYAVVIGYDLDRREMILHSGVEAREVLAIDEFAETWRPGRYWGLLTLAPQKFPITAREEVYLKAVIGLEQTERWAEARQAYAHAANRWPDNRTAWIGLGNSRYALGNLAGAEQAFRSAVDAAPQSGAAYNNLAHVLMELDRQEEALEVIEQAIRLGGPLAEVFQKTRTEIQQRIDS